MPVQTVRSARARRSSARPSVVYTSRERADAVAWRWPVRRSAARPLPSKARPRPRLCSTCDWSLRRVLTHANASFDQPVRAAPPAGQIPADTSPAPRAGPATPLEISVSTMHLALHAQAAQIRLGALDRSPRPSPSATCARPAPPAASISPLTSIVRVRIRRQLARAQLLVDRLKSVHAGDCVDRSPSWRSCSTCARRPQVIRNTMWPFSYLDSTCSTCASSRARALPGAAPGISITWLSVACAVSARSVVSSPCR